MSGWDSCCDGSSFDVAIADNYTGRGGGGMVGHGFGSMVQVVEADDFVVGLVKLA